MKIISYNVNGIRAAPRNDFLEWLAAAARIVLWLEEIKATPEQFDPSIFEELGYYHNYWFPAQKKGYSGVAVLCKQKPKDVAYGTGIDYMDAEGRNLRVDFEDVSVMSLYLPSGTNPERLAFKFTYMDDFQTYINTLKQSHPNLVICGDYNICHEAIDIHDPVRNAKVSGFLPEERAWLDAFIQQGFTDSFRHLNSDPHQYSWWSYRANARANNKGWRIDYAMVSEPLTKHIERAFILTQAVHSDHCPVGVTLRL